MGLLRNMPFRPAAWLLRLCIFPLGRPFSGPKDSLGQNVAKVLLKPSELRNRLTAGIFLPPGPAEPLGRLEDALDKAIAAEVAERKVRDAIREGHITAGTEEESIEAGFSAGIISRKEAEKMKLAIEARREVIKVDDFPFLGKKDS